MSGTKMEETEMSETTNKPEKVFPYSYHTFIFPFIFNDLAPGRLHLAPQCAGGKPCLAQRDLRRPPLQQLCSTGRSTPAYTEGISPLDTLR